MTNQKKENILVALTIEIGDGSCFLYWKWFWICVSTIFLSLFLFKFELRKLGVLYFLKKSTALAQKCFARVAAMWHYQQDKRFLHGNFQKRASTMVQKFLWIRNLSNDTTYAMLRHTHIQGVCCSDLPTLKSHRVDIRWIRKISSQIHNHFTLKMRRTSKEYGFWDQVKA